MKIKLSELNYGDRFALLRGSDIVYRMIQRPKGRETGIKVKDPTGAVGRLSGSRYVYKIEKEDYYV